jgi:hypothetical protein
LTSQPDKGGNDDSYDEKKRHKNGGSDFTPGRMVVYVGAVVHDSNCTIGLGGVGASRGTARGRSLISDSKDGASGVKCLEGRSVSGNDGQLEIGGLGGVPPLWLEGSLIRTGGEVDIVPYVDAGVAGAGRIEVYIGVVCGVTRRVPGDIDRCSVRERLSGSGRLVEPASAAGYK